MILSFTMMLYACSCFFFFLLRQSVNVALICDLFNVYWLLLLSTFVYLRMCILVRMCILAVEEF